MTSHDKNAPKEDGLTDGYPVYPPSEDIYSKETELENVDPEDPTRMKETNEKAGEWNEKDFTEELTGDDLDVPGSAAEEEDEKPGSEDEENEYYSLGGDDHNDLDEDKG
ncbi:MAG: hypothetical protein ABI444_06360 [Candidatus Kapaibacterium sp.]|jgi:hypothetical protein